MAFGGMLSTGAQDAWCFGACGGYGRRLPTAGTVQVLPMLCIGKTPETRNTFKRSQKSLVSHGWNPGGFWLENGSENDPVAGRRPRSMPSG
jgi:hypothetical protein